MPAEFFAGGRARSMSYALPIILTGSCSYLEVKRSAKDRIRKEDNITTTPNGASLARTAALRRALDDVTDAHATEDLLFLESWEANSVFSVATVLRASQIRRANPCLAAEIRTELRRR